MILKNRKRHEDIYDKISSLYGIKFKAQLKDSPIEFKAFYHLVDVITSSECYQIIFINDERIIYSDKSDFIAEFRIYIQSKIIELQDEFEELNSREYYGMKYDENEVFNQHERIGHWQYKLNQILDKFKMIKD